VKLQIVYDNQAEKDFKSGWGFACLVDERILFDTGEEPKSLLDNLARLGMEPTRIEAVVISHDHWDHTGGLWKLLQKRPGLPVYGCPGFSRGFKNKVALLGGRLIECAGYTEIEPNIAVSGEIMGEYKSAPLPEQALMVKTALGLALITGCSHPGIIQVVKTVRHQLPKEKIRIVLGGFHMKAMDQKDIDSIIETLQKLGVERIGPTHCTGQTAQKSFAQKFGKNFLTVRAGAEFTV